MHWISPRESAGFSTLLASIAPFRAAGADQRVQLVDEEDHVLGAAHLGHDRLDALLELAAILGAGDHQRQVEHDDALGAQRSPGRCPSTMRWASPSTIAVLPTPASPSSTGLFLVRRDEDLDHALDLVLAADDRVELASRARDRSGRARTRRAPESCSCCCRSTRRRGRAAPPALAAAAALFRALRSNPDCSSRAEELEHLFAHVLELDAEVHQDLRRDALRSRGSDPSKQMLGADVVVAELARLFHRQLEHLLGARRERQLAHRHRRGAGLDDLLDLVADLARGRRSCSFRTFAATPDPSWIRPSRHVLRSDVLVVEPLGLLAGESSSLSWRDR